MAQFPDNAKYRMFATGGNNSKSFHLNRKGNVITVQQHDTNSFKTVTFKTVAEAKHVMANPITIVI
jgi:hypothetical protein